MSIEADVQRDAIEMLINMNPTSVTVERIEYIVSGGARTTSKSTVGPFNIALFSNVAKGSPKSIQITTTSVKMDQIEWSALAKHDSDFESGGNISDSFSIAGKGKFRVQTVVDIDTYGETTGKLLYLEMLK